MMDYAHWGDAQNVRNIFEGLSTQAIDAIAAAMPELIDKLTDGTYAAEDFEAALAKLQEAEIQAGKDAWQDYFQGTADGLKAQSAQWREAMRGIIAEVSGAENRANAFYAALMRLSDDGLDVSGLLSQYGALAVALLDGSASADELYASLSRLGELEALQKRIHDRIKAILGIEIAVSLVEPKSLDRYTGKAQRVLDLRGENA